MLTLALGGLSFPHSANEETEAQREQTCPRSHSGLGAELALAQAPCLPALVPLYAKGPHHERFQLSNSEGGLEVQAETLPQLWQAG